MKASRGVDPAYYPHSPLQRATIVPFFQQHLATFGPLSESGCPTSAKRLESWVAGALKFGRRIKKSDPQRVLAILDEIGEASHTEVRMVTGATLPYLTRSIFERPR